MGKQESENREKITLIDFLYKDTNLINSFYSQIFGGDLMNLSKSEVCTDESGNSIEGNGGFIKGDASSKHSNSENLTKNINPYDYKVIELLETFNLNKTSLAEAKTGSIIAIDGKLIYRNFDIIAQAIPFISKSNLVDEFNAPLSSNARGKNKKMTLGSMVQDMMKLIPYGLEFGVDTDTKETATCILKQEHLTISPDDLFRAYGNNIPNLWTIIGILDVTEFSKSSSKSQFKKMIDSTSSVFSAMVLEENSNVIRPIAIYRKLTI